MPPKDRPNRANTAQITFRVPIDMAEWLRDRARANARQPGAELMLLLRPAYEADMKQRAFVVAQRALALKALEPEARSGKRPRRKPEEGVAVDGPDLFAKIADLSDPRIP